jgi:hypothetical protein
MHGAMPQALAVDFRAGLLTQHLVVLVHNIK